MRKFIDIVEAAQQTPAQRFEKYCESMGILYTTGGTLHIRPVGENTVLIETVSVEPEYRGQGIGNELMKSIMSEADEQGVGLVLEVNSHNDGGPDSEQLYDWYSNLGFENDSDGLFNEYFGIAATYMHYNFNDPKIVSEVWGEDDEDDHS